MPRITPISWKKFEKFLFFVGCKLAREKGDHLPIFIIRNNLRVLGISPEEYLAILEKI